MSDPGKAVFLSYASQDAEAAKRIADALRGAGVEVWFDAEGGLEHGDEWDAKIRRQIKECVLFLPIISTNTQAREEGYFRIEWDLAAERARGIASGVAFILPVVIDGTKEPEALVPDRFRMVQWTKLPGGTVSPEVLQRFLKLWSHRTGALKAAREAENVGGASRPDGLGDSGRKDPPTKTALYVGASLGLLVLAAAAYVMFKPRRSPEEIAKLVAQAQQIGAETGKKDAAPQSEAQQLLAKTWDLLTKPSAARAELAAADELCKRAAALDPTNADVWAAWSTVHSWYIFHNLDSTTARREAARDATARAMQLAPKSYEARLAQALFWTRGEANRATRLGRRQQQDEAEQLLRELLAERPDEPRALFTLGFLCTRGDKEEEGLKLLERAAADPAFAAVAWQELGWYQVFQTRYPEAEAADERSIAVLPYWNNLTLKIRIVSEWYGDLDQAKAALKRIPTTSRQEDWGVALTVHVLSWRREHREIIRFLENVPAEWLSSNWYEGPTALLMGEARELAGQPEAARRDFRRALAQVAPRLEQDPNNYRLLRLKAWCLYHLGERAEAEKAHQAFRELRPTDDYQLLAMAGPSDAFFTWAEKSIFQDKRRWPTAAMLRLSPLFDNVRADPRFAALVQRAEADPGLSPKAREAATPPAVPLSPARELAEKARALIAPWDMATKDDFALADQFLKKARELDPADGEVWAVSALLECGNIVHHHLESSETAAAARAAAERAVRLAPDSDLARFTRAFTLRFNPQTASDAVLLLQQEAERQPRNGLVLRTCGLALYGADRPEEALRWLDRAAALPGGDPIAHYARALVFNRQLRLAEGEAAIDEALKLVPHYARAVNLKLNALMDSHQDLQAARSLLEKAPSQLYEDTQGLVSAAHVWLYARDVRRCVAVLRPAPDYLDTTLYAGPKNYITGMAYAAAGSAEAAQTEWRVALKVVEQRLAERPNVSLLLLQKAQLLALLGQREAAEKLLVEIRQRGEVARYGMAVLLLAVGRSEESLALLEEIGIGYSVRNRTDLRFHPVWDPLRANPRFQALLKTLPTVEAAK